MQIPTCRSIRADPYVQIHTCRPPHPHLRHVGRVRVVDSVASRFKNAPHHTHPRTTLCGLLRLASVLCASTPLCTISTLASERKRNVMRLCCRCGCGVVTASRGLLDTIETSHGNATNYFRLKKKISAYVPPNAPALSAHVQARHFARGALSRPRSSIKIGECYNKKRQKRDKKGTKKGQKH